jgi:myo-inositol 2-dehydrogenase / D-chiro-inositol 1-dehydrogenase
VDRRAAATIRVIETLGVGILGAGPVTQAIHLPTLARLADRFRVVAVMDVDPDTAQSVAARAGATPATTIEAVLEDPDVDVVAVCSPHAFHAEQVTAICAAGKRGILCEKPLATSREDAGRIATAVSEAGIPIVVGAMHVYDPGWLAAVEACADRLGDAHTVRSTIVLPRNDRYEDWAAEIAGRPAAAARPTTPLDRVARAARVQDLVLGLWVHDLPLVRAFAPVLDEVQRADVCSPFGGLVSLTAAGRRVDLVAFIRPLWRPDWRLEVWGDDWSMRVSFTPSYVHAGSATAVVRDRGGERQYRPMSHNGYEGEWVELHDLVTTSAEPRHPVTDVVDDITFVTDIAEGAAAAVLAGGAP